MFDWKKYVYPPVYVIILLVAIALIYKAFTVGLEKGEYVGKYEPHTEGGPVVVEEETYDLATLLEPTDELVTQGEELYNLNCASCHGPGGLGDGPKSAGLNPPPRKFPNEQFKQGAGTLQIYQTLQTGVPGSSMASFSFLNPGELMSLAHFVRTFIPNPPSDPAALVQQLAPAAGGGAAAPAAPSDSAAGDSASADSSQMAPAAPGGPALPVDFVIERMLATQDEQVRPLLNVPSVYAELCAACHGPRGEGAVVPREFPHIGTVYARTRPLSSTPGKLLADQAALSSFLASGIPGQDGHRFSELTAGEVDELLQAIRQAAGR
jgi:mono/diheme cytochrome c family protein